MNKWLFHQMNLQELRTRNLSATVTRGSNFVEEKVFLFYHRQDSRPVHVSFFTSSMLPSRCIRSHIAQQVNCNALSMFKALNKCFQ